MADEDDVADHDDLALGADMDMDMDEEDDTGMDDRHQHDDDLEGEAVGGGWVATGEIERTGEQSATAVATTKPKARAVKQKPASAAPKPTKSPVQLGHAITSKSFTAVLHIAATNGKLRRR